MKPLDAWAAMPNLGQQQIIGTLRGRKLATTVCVYWVDCSMLTLSFHRFLWYPIFVWTDHILNFLKA